MNILLHICCGPCLIHPFKVLKDLDFNITGFYYNPNIHPAEEYLSRLNALRTVSREFGLPVAIPEYDETEYLREICGCEKEPGRCELCWSLRLFTTAREAKNKGFDAFSTTLLVSPYQNHLRLKQLGHQIGREAGVDFIYQDFRPGFRDGQAEARRMGIYRQKYCGCKHSIRPKNII
ncbi:MAG: epoxyqueuosine reductase QueH [Candidatus Omnitrophica bacterium]|jgi:hypothetical protein|nr:epoxyqueuosine reductase QueH [Candidatus Omnitrophota bacterium]MDD3274351.1 epoxyqueuosine reductase QueH [Candidatus Omnitrophota bacterium]MDD5724925.1 epoxyqueuosine reductase QueH [Candidatus Omnitrophota bacterium]